MPKKKLHLIEIETFKNAVSVSNNHCLKFVRQQSVSSVDISLIVHIGYAVVGDICTEQTKNTSRITTDKLQLCLIAQYLIEHEVL